MSLQGPAASGPVAPEGSVAARFDPHPSCSSSARRFVVDTCSDWQLERYADDAALCAGELVSNVILHARAPFTVGLRRLPAGLRLDVHDDRPDLWPVFVPRSTVYDELATTGRGLAIVAALAARWGCFTTDVAKTMWAEFLDGRRPDPPEPQVELASTPAANEGHIVTVHGLPTRAAIASGMQIDDLVREIQLSPAALDAAATDRFNRLLDLTARLRLTGRQEAFRAAAAGRPTVSLRLAATPEEVDALGELGELLAQLAAGSGLEAAEPPQEVIVMRRWLVNEIAAQWRGAAPSTYPAPPAEPDAQGSREEADER